MEHAQRLTLAEMREFVASSGSLSFTGAERKEIHGLVERTLQAHEYLRLSKKNKGVVRRYLTKISGRSFAQITRLIRRYRQSGPSSPRRYSRDDMALPAAVDAAHEGLSGPSPRRILGREYHVYGKAAYRRLIFDAGGGIDFTSDPFGRFIGYRNTGAVWLAAWK